MPILGLRDVLELRLALSVSIVCARAVPHAVHLARRHLHTLFLNKLKLKSRCLPLLRNLLLRVYWLVA